VDLDIVSIQEVLQHLGPNGSGRAPGGWHQVPPQQVTAAEDVQLSMRWVNRGRKLEVHATVTVFGKSESRWLPDIPSLTETIELIEWLTGYTVTKDIHES